MAIEIITSISLSEAQQQAARKLALRNSDKTAQEVVDAMFASVLKSRVKACRDSAAEDAGAKYDMAQAAGFEPPMPRAEFVAKARESWHSLYQELQ